MIGMSMCDKVFKAPRKLLERTQSVCLKGQLDKQDSTQPTDQQKLEKRLEAMEELLQCLLDEVRLLADVSDDETYEPLDSSE